MKFEKLEYARSTSDSVDSLSHNLKQFGYDIRFGVRLLPYVVKEKPNEIELVWEMELGSGKTLHYWYNTYQKWKVWDLTNPIDKNQVEELLEESYIYFYKKFRNDPYHVDAISNMYLAKRPFDAHGVHRENTLTRLEGLLSNLAE